MIGAAALLIIAACGQKAEQPAAEAPAAGEPIALISGIDVSGMDTSVRPGDDFFAYVNGTWVKETEMPADKARYGVFDKLRDESQEAVKVIIEQSATGDFAKGTDEQKVGDLYNSYLDWDTRNAKGIEPLQPDAVYFAEATKRALDAPFGVGQLPDPKDPQRYAIAAGQSGLGLPDREFYLKDDEKSEDIRNKYVAHIAKMFDLAGLADGAAAADTIMALETRITIAPVSRKLQKGRARGTSGPDAELQLGWFSRGARNLKRAVHRRLYHGLPQGPGRHHYRHRPRYLEDIPDLERAQ
jgi:putative endopeptidase